VPSPHSVAPINPISCPPSPSFLHLFPHNENSFFINPPPNLELRLDPEPFLLFSSLVLLLPHPSLLDLLPPRPPPSSTSSLLDLLPPRPPPSSTSSYLVASRPRPLGQRDINSKTLAPSHLALDVGVRPTSSTDFTIDGGVIPSSSADRLRHRQGS
jgi:hypothetical protein